MSKFKVGDRVVLLPPSELPAEKRGAPREEAILQGIKSLGPPPWEVHAVFANENCIGIAGGAARYFSWRFKLAEPTQMELF